jgi:hypothetical protein
VEQDASLAEVTPMPVFDPNHDAADAVRTGEVALPIGFT